MTASISSTLNEETYSSSSMVNLDSFETLAIRLAISCMTLSGAVNSSVNLVVCSL